MARWRNRQQWGESFAHQWHLHIDPGCWHLQIDPGHLQIDPGCWLMVTDGYSFRTTEIGSGPSADRFSWRGGFCPPPPLGISDHVLILGKLPILPDPCLNSQVKTPNPIRTLWAWDKIHSLRYYAQFRGKFGQTSVSVMTQTKLGFAGKLR